MRLPYQFKTFHSQWQYHTLPRSIASSDERMMVHATDCVGAFSLSRRAAWSSSESSLCSLLASAFQTSLASNEKSADASVGCGAASLNSRLS